MNFNLFLNTVYTLVGIVGGIAGLTVILWGAVKFVHDPQKNHKKREIAAAVTLATLLSLTLIGVAVFVVYSMTPTDRHRVPLSAATSTSRTPSPMPQQTVSTPTATFLTQNQNPYPPYKGTLAFDDPLHANSSGYWEVYSDKGYSCQFRAEAYHASESKQGEFLHCSALSINFSNFAYQVKMTILKGDQGGIVFRANDEVKQFYYFHISTSGTYSFDIADGEGYTSLTTGFSQMIHTGLGQVNLIAVVAIDHTLTLYVNMQKVASVSNTAYTQGHLGVVADDQTQPTEVMFNDARVWKL